MKTVGLTLSSRGINRSDTVSNQTNMHNKQKMSDTYPPCPQFFRIFSPAAPEGICYDYTESKGGNDIMEYQSLSEPETPGLGSHRLEAAPRPQAAGSTNTHVSFYKLRGRTNQKRTPIFRIGQLSGNIGLQRLLCSQAITLLDKDSFFTRSQAEDAQGRALIVRSIIPYGTVPCGWLAAWIWLGGEEFPHTIDLISHSHYRTLLYGRQIRINSREISPEQVSYVGTVRLTSPVRTACDLSCLTAQEKKELNAYQTIGDLAIKCGFTCHDCLQALWNHPRWRGHEEGVMTFNNPQLKNLMDAASTVKSSASKDEKYASFV
ncbi:conserved hypothetical protein [Scardovia inopinata JCM 12537]|nr:conserved hypothetical protein [Scardovia inopinata JCM 12537]